jgi:Zn-dependent protease
MIDFQIGEIPVRVQPWFFLTALLIGPRDLQGMVLWVPVVFVGVLAHELGHAMAVRRLGLRPAIQLFGFGGLTSWYGGEDVSPGKRAMVSAAGPAVGLAIGTLAMIAAPALQTSGPLLGRTLQYVVWVNLGWGLLNLLPILPLDGGHIATSFAEMVFGPAGRRTARILSIVACVVLGLVALRFGWLWSAIIAAVLAFSNIQALRANSAEG